MIMPLSIFILKDGLAKVFVSETLSFLVRNNKGKGFNFLDHLILYTAYADDTTIFLENKESIQELLETFALLSSFSGLKPAISKYEICELQVCGMQSVDLTSDAIKTIGIYFCYNMNLRIKKLLSSYYQYSWHFKTMEDEKSFC